MSAKLNRLREKAFSLHEAGDLREALKYFERIFVMAPEEIECVRRAADIYLQLDDLDEAVRYYHLAIENYIRDGLFLKGISLCKEVLAILPEHSSTKKLLSKIHGRQKEEKKNLRKSRLPLPLETKPKVSLGSVLKKDRPSRSPAPLDIPVTPLFSNLPKAAFLDFVSGMKKHTANLGDRIIKEGDQGNSFFVIISGRVRVEKGGRKKRTLAFLSDGAFFGEMALINRSPRTASVVVVSKECLYFEFDHEKLEEASVKHPSIHRVMVKFCENRLLATTMTVHPLFRAFHRSVRRELMSLFRSRTFDQGDILIVAGKKTKGLYLVLAGKLEVVTATNTADEQLAGELSPGDMFGEMSMLSGEPAMASVRASEETRVLRLPASSFRKVAEVYPEVLDLLDSLAHERRVLNQTILSGSSPLV